jgi:hypothetical protein
MQTVNNSNFGIAIAYLLPGVIALWGVSFVSETVRGWFGATPGGAATVGGFLQVTLASLAVGLLISVVRWGIVDTIHHMTGVRPPRWNFADLRRDFHVFEGLVENHYRYYQFFSGSLIAAVIVYLTARFRAHALPGSFGWPDVAFLAAAVLLFLGSRDTLKKYYRRTSQLSAGW